LGATVRQRRKERKGSIHQLALRAVGNLTVAEWFALFIHRCATSGRGASFVSL
jgi:hypothetical protein